MKPIIREFDFFADLLADWRKVSIRKYECDNPDFKHTRVLRRAVDEFEAALQKAIGTLEKDMPVYDFKVGDCVTPIEKVITYHPEIGAKIQLSRGLPLVIEQIDGDMVRVVFRNDDYRRYPAPKRTSLEIRNLMPYAEFFDLHTTPGKL